MYGLAHDSRNRVARALTHLEQVLEVLDLDLVAVKADMGNALRLSVVDNDEFAVLLFLLLENEIEHGHLTHETRRSRHQVVFHRNASIHERERHGVEGSRLVRAVRLHDAHLKVNLGAWVMLKHDNAFEHGLECALELFDFAVEIGGIMMSDQDRKYYLLVALDIASMVHCREVRHEELDVEDAPVLA